MERGGDLEAFLAEMWGLKKAEEQGTDEMSKTANFQELNPDELTEKDRAIWEKLQNHALTREEFNEYRNEVWRGGNQSRKAFSGLIGNKLGIQLQERELEEWKNSRKSGNP